MTPLEIAKYLIDEVTKTTALKGTKDDIIDAVGEPVYGTGRQRRGKHQVALACIVEGCDEPVRARGWCNRHYVRYVKHGHPLGGGRKRPGKGEVRAFIDAALLVDHDDCIRWPYARNGNGYGQFNLEGVNTLVHRFVCEAVNGPPPTPSSLSAHLCGMGHEGCMSPRHLAWKSPQGNSADQVRHGAAIRGGRVGSAKLTEEQVIEIRRKLLKGTNQRQIATAYGMSQSTISMIASGRNWGWLSANSSPGSSGRAA